MCVAVILCKIIYRCQNKDIFQFYICFSSEVLLKHFSMKNRNEPSRPPPSPPHQTRKLFSGLSPKEEPGEKNGFLSTQFHLHHCCKYNDRTPGVHVQYSLNNASGKDELAHGLIWEEITRAPRRNWFPSCGRRPRTEIVVAGLRLAFIKAP